MLNAEHTASKDDQSILTAVLVKDAAVQYDKQTEEKRVELHLEEVVKVEGEFSPGTLVIHHLAAEKITGELSALTKGTSIRLITDLLPPTTRSMPPMVDGQYIKEITVLD